MDKEIVGQKKAENKFLFISSYLKSEWSISVATEFINKVEEKTHLLKSFPKVEADQKVCFLDTFALRTLENRQDKQVLEFDLVEIE
ncbi:MAG: hypothetical protein QME58_12365 [Bacteroidota bacterium]|nr:hypothetical protein [Bacteroidota bacterium]